MHLFFDTIAAISTPPGDGGIGIVRISGPKAKTIAKILFTSRDKIISGFRSHYLHHGFLIDPLTKTTIDEVLLTLMKAPNSYTGEDVVEIHAHGGQIVLIKVLEAVIKEGARHAEQGEFTRRAFLNGRIDLTQAEAVIDVINARTDKALSYAQRDLQGGLKKEIEGLKEGVLDIITLLEAELDFSEEEVTAISKEELLKRIEDNIRRIEQLLSTYKEGSIMKHGLSTLILGRTNVGKSSLLNCLLKENRAIVTHIPGTTRDMIQEFINIKGILVKIIDTAGLRKTASLIEKEGIKIAMGKVKEAQVILFVVDGNSRNPGENIHLLDGLDSKKIIVVINKIDKVSPSALKRLRVIFKDYRVVEISALHGKGIDTLKETIASKAVKSPLNSSSSIVISNLRHKRALEKSREALQRARHTTFRDLMAVDLKNALTSLKEIIGEVTTGDILDRIFSRFCIGK
ncbi:MAG: tRNA uridine-5-carboxymethylaminomethyl(34) synthesis GTPase MnmE [Thermodesulfobacteriota bacterium]